MTTGLKLVMVKEEVLQLSMLITKCLKNVEHVLLRRKLNNIVTATRKYLNVLVH